MTTTTFTTDIAVEEGIGRCAVGLGQPQRAGTRDRDQAVAFFDAGKLEQLGSEEISLKRVTRLLIELRVRVGRRGGRSRPAPVRQRRHRL